MAKREYGDQRDNLKYSGQSWPPGTWSAGLGCVQDVPESGVVGEAVSPF